MSYRTEKSTLEKTCWELALNVGPVTEQICSQEIVIDTPALTCSTPSTVTFNQCLTILRNVNHMKCMCMTQNQVCEYN